MRHPTTARRAVFSPHPLRAFDTTGIANLQTIVAETKTAVEAG